MWVLLKHHPTVDLIRPSDLEFRDTLGLVTHKGLTLYGLYRQKGTIPPLNIRGASVASSEGRGRFPTNLCFLHHESCTKSQCHSSCPVKELETQSGWLAPSGKVVERKSGGNSVSTFKSTEKGTTWVRHDDGGTAARFYPVFYSTKEFWSWVETLFTLPTTPNDPLNSGDVMCKS